MLCDECMNGFYGLADDGCRLCECNDAGTVPGTHCDKDTGQCVCKANAMGRDCSLCKDTFYNLQLDNELVSLKLLELKNYLYLMISYFFYYNLQLDNELVISSEQLVQNRI